MSENVRLKEQLTVANTTIQALTVFSSRHDNVLSLLTNKLTNKMLVGNYDGLSLEIEHSISTLRSEFPFLTSLIITQICPLP